MGKEKNIIIKYEGEYLNDEKNGEGKSYNKEGQLESEGFYYNGEILNGKVYSPKKDSYEGEY